MLFADLATPSYQEIAALSLVSLAATHLLWRFIRAGLRAWASSPETAAAGCGGGCQGCGVAAKNGPQLIMIQSTAGERR